MVEEKIILSEDLEAAQQVTETFWKSSRGNYFLKEKAARYDGSTHFRCECGNIVKRMAYTVCESCQSKKKAERFAKLKKKKWDGKNPICLYQDDQFFYSEDELDDYCSEIRGFGSKPEELMLVHCEPSRPRILEAGEFLEELFPDDDSWDLPKEIYEAAQYFNETVEDQMPFTWEPSDIAVIL